MSSNLKRRTFAFIGHPRSSEHLEYELKKKNPNTKLKTRNDLFSAIDETAPFISEFWGSYLVSSRFSLSGFHVVVPTTYEYMVLRPKQTNQKILQAIGIAASLQPNALTLGGLTSSFFKQKIENAAREYKITITNGNALTCAIVARTVKETALKTGIKMDQAHVAILGAAGSIGKGCCRLLGKDVDRLILIGRTKRKLGALQKELNSQGINAILGDITPSCLKNCEIVISATTAPNRFLHDGYFKEGALLFDVGHPCNLSVKLAKNENLLMFRGGLVAVPEALRFDVDIGVPNEFMIYACYAEAMVLALEGVYPNEWRDIDQITPEKTDMIYQMASKHGFREANLLNLQSLSSWEVNN